MKRYGRLDENLQGTLQKNRVFCAVMPIHDQRISRRTETRRLFELTKLKKAPSFVIVGLFSADHYLVPCLSLLSSECVVFTDVPRDFQRLAEYFSDGWRREGVIDSSCLFKIGAEVRTVRWKISNNTHPVPVLNNTHPFPSKCSVDALCRVRESVRFASERSRVRIPPSPPNQKSEPLSEGTEVRIFLVCSWYCRGMNSKRRIHDPWSIICSCVAQRSTT